MSAVIRPPLHDWRRHHPAARRIAAAILEHPDLLRLRTTRIAADAQARFDVCAATARLGVAFARRAANKAGDCASRGTRRQG